MIEIVLDGNSNNEFCGKKYPVIELNNLTPKKWNEYKQIASQLIINNSDQYAIIININNSDLSINKLALALFSESIKIKNELEYAVFKVKNLQEARNQYKPYVALTIAIKYALNLANETPKIIYKNISELGYLGIKTQKNYTDNTMTLSLLNASTPPHIINSNAIQNTICAVALLKALSLAEIPINIELNIDLSETPTTIDKDNLVEKIINDVSPWIN